MREKKLLDPTPPATPSPFPAHKLFNANNIVKDIHKFSFLLMICLIQNVRSEAFIQNSSRISVFIYFSPPSCTGFRNVMNIYLITLTTQSVLIAHSDIRGHN